MGVGSNPTPGSVSFAISKIDMSVSSIYFLYLRFIKKEKSSYISITVRMADRSKGIRLKATKSSVLKLSILVH